MLVKEDDALEMKPPVQYERPVVVAVAAWRRRTFTVPDAETEKIVVVALPVEEEMLKRSDAVSDTGAKMVSLASGVVVPMPTDEPMK